MTLRNETFPEKTYFVRIIVKLTPESSGMVEKQGGTAIKWPRHNFQPAGTNEQNAAYRCAWHENNKDFIILPRF